MTAKHRPGHVVFVINVTKGRFVLSQNGKGHSCALNRDALVELFKKEGFDPRNESHVLMAGSSCDFPEEDGAPRGTNVSKIIRDARMELTQ